MFTDLFKKTKHTHSDMYRFRVSSQRFLRKAERAPQNEELCLTNSGMEEGTGNILEI